MKKNAEPTDTNRVTSQASAGSGPKLAPEVVVECLAHVQAVVQLLAPVAVKLTTAERRAQTKFRKEGDTVIPVLVRLGTAAGLASAGLDVDAMQQQAELASALVPLLTSVKTLADTIGDTVLAAHGESWHTATTLHGALLRKAKKDPSLRRDMEVVASAFTYRKRAATTPAAEPTTETSATPATRPA